MMLKKTLLIIYFISIFIGCTHTKNENTKSITVSILPIKYIVEQIVENDFPIEVLVPAGSSPETYEPTPRQIINLNNSQLLFSTGLIDFEKILTDKIKHSSAIKIVELSKGIDIISGNCSHIGHSHGIDPHIWTSPKELKLMSENIYNEITLLYPDSSKYLNNYQSLINRLDSLDNIIRTKVNQTPLKYFIIYHPALTYYAREYGIEQIALEDEGKEPSVDRLKSIITAAKNDGIKYIFYQSQFSRSSVEAVASDIGAQAIEIDPLSGDVVNNLVYITNIITTK